MKQSEYKQKLEEQRKLFESQQFLPKTIYILECKNKVYAMGGCMCCWHCDKCGRSGCDNLIGFRQGDKLEKQLCDLEEG